MLFTQSQVREDVVYICCFNLSILSSPLPSFSAPLPPLILMNVMKGLGFFYWKNIRIQLALPTVRDSFPFIKKKKCVSHLRRETGNENKQFKETKTYNIFFIFDQTRLSRVLPCLQGTSLLILCLQSL